VQLFVAALGTQSFASYLGCRASSRESNECAAVSTERWRFESLWRGMMSL